MSLSLGRFPGFEFPVDPRDANQWDDFWRDTIDSAPELGGGVMGPHLTAGKHPVGPTDARNYSQIRGGMWDELHWKFIDLFYRWGVHRVLMPGSGICVLPHFYSHAGFEVTAADLSQLANDFSRTTGPTQGWWWYWLGQCPFPGVEVSISRRLAGFEDERIEATRQPGGRLGFIRGDILDGVVAKGSMDAVVVRMLLEHYDLEGRLALARSLNDCLRDGGTLVIETNCTREWLTRNSRPIWMAIDDELRQSGFEVHWLHEYGPMTPAFHLPFNPLDGRSDATRSTGQDPLVTVPWNQWAKSRRGESKAPEIAKRAIILSI